VTNGAASRGPAASGGSSGSGSSGFRAGVSSGGGDVGGGGTVDLATLPVGMQMGARVETYRRACLDALGQAGFDALYGALKSHLFAEMGDDDDGSAAGEAARLDALTTAKARVPRGKEPFIEHVSTLLHMEDQLL